MARQMRETAGIDTGPHPNTALGIVLSESHRVVLSQCTLLQRDANVSTGTLERAEITDDRGAFRIIRVCLRTIISI